MVVFLRKHFPVFFAFIYRLYKRTHIHCQRGNCLDIGNALLCRCNVVVKGRGNEIRVNSSDNNPSILVDVDIYISGDNNLIEIGQGCSIKKVQFHIEDDKSKISMGQFTQMFGPVHLAAIEGTNVEIGAGCLFSQGITIRTGDSHSIIDLAMLKRINQSKDIYIGEHVWVGQSVTILKGTTIAHDSIIGAGSLLTGKHYLENSIYGGVPASLIRTGVSWDANRVKDGTCK